MKPSLLRPALFALLIGTVLATCTPDRTFPADPTPTPTPTPVGAKLVPPVVNEFVSKGSTQNNEFGVASDWVELYNPNDTTYTLAAGAWYLTDDLADPTKQALPALVLPARGHVVIWCDSQDTVATQVHTSFNLSASGGDVGLMWHRPAQPDTVVSAYTYPLQTASGASLGRATDGAPTWILFPAPTPGAPNR